MEHRIKSPCVLSPGIIMTPGLPLPSERNWRARSLCLCRLSDCGRGCLSPQADVYRAGPYHASTSQVCLFGAREISFEAVNEPVQHKPLAVIQRNACQGFPKPYFKIRTVCEKGNFNKEQI